MEHAIDLLPVRATTRDLDAPAAGGGTIAPRVGVVVRAGTAADVSFVDRMQKAHGRELGFLPTMALLGKVQKDEVLIAEVGGRAAGYLIAADRYFKRDDVGYVTQIGIVPEYRRSLVAATLLQAQFDKSAYGCRLYSCWCAQDLKANDFWAAMGFTPIAFRTGSRTKGRDASGKAVPRIHIFWQKRVRPGDDGDVSRGGTPWWYPAVTGGGELREDRIAFPIPPGVSWRDVLPSVLPEQANALIERAGGEREAKALGVSGEIPPAKPATPSNRATTPSERATTPAAPRPATKNKPAPPVAGGGLWFTPAPAGVSPDARREAKAARRAERAATAAPAAKIDPRWVAMARELRDRWGERAAFVAALPGKHDVRRAADAAAPRDAIAWDDAAAGAGLPAPLSAAA